jgi:hypothetical protein
MAVISHEKPDTVVVGTSTGKSAIDPRQWPGKLVNLADDGQTVFYSIAAARAFSEAPGVERIIIAIDPADLASGLENPSAKRIWRIAPLVASIPDIAPLLGQTRPVSEAPFFLTSWRFRGDVAEIVSKLGRTKAKPYRPLTAGVSLPEPVVEPPGAAGLKIHETVLPYLDVLARVARTSGKEIVLTIAPIYRERYSDRPSTAAILAELRRRLAGVPVCDLMERDTPALVAMRRDPANFHDSVHHTEAGAQVFTTELAQLVAQHCAQK